MKRAIAILFSVAMLVAAPLPSHAADQPRQDQEALKTAIFAGGCFWCVEEAFDKVPGVVETISGYTGGDIPNPSYRQVSAGGTGHFEAVRVRFDPRKVSYAQLLTIFWRNVDPFDDGGQFCDRGNSYRSAIFVGTDAQRRLAEASKAKYAKRFGRPIATEVRAATAFYPAEAYHQNYHMKNPLKYRFYKWRCGRAQRLQKIWDESS